MPAWIWIVLVLFFIVMVVAGLVYAGKRAIAAMHVIGETSAKTFGVLDRLGQQAAPRRPEPPSYTQPLHVAADRYAEAHAEVIRHQDAVRDRHVAIWRRWKEFNA
ncbi:hypothetical protein GFD17_08860 [Bifidobacterium sp. SMB2]|uniref:Prolyl aminopeptidase n=1 Tax=Bifidobacterium saimiriisciurei TaxID=2661627 RepID=A0ABX0CGQ9_9BIFI|nr:MULTISPECIES: hypothetical protein [Bifidobacterium]NEG96855.1 hypothetical protein [Bifidobacterium sp. SMB2]NEH11615.1 hypothetical protein [Bifidobacterium saimiriisciurei]